MALLEAVRLHGGDARGIGELRSHHQSPSADVDDAAVEPLLIAKAGAELIAAGAHVLEEPGLGEHVDRRERGRASDRVAAVGAAVAALRPSGHELVGGPDRRDRESRAEPLRHHEHVGTHAVVLDGEHAPGASEAGLHLVGDEQDAVLAADLSRPRRKATGAGR